MVCYCQHDQQSFHILYFIFRLFIFIENAIASFLKSFLKSFLSFLLTNSTLALDGAEQPLLYWNHQLFSPPIYEVTAWLTAQLLFKNYFSFVIKRDSSYLFYIDVFIVFRFRQTMDLVCVFANSPQFPLYVVCFFIVYPLFAHLLSKQLLPLLTK